MKKLIPLPFIVFLSLALTALDARSQCGNELLEVCVEKFEGGRFSRSFPVQLDEQRQGETLPVRKYSVLLTSGTTYKVATCNATEFPGKAIISIHHEDELIGSTYLLDTREHLPFLLFECTQTGLYSLSLYFENGKQGCAVGIILPQ
jgi:hypothetical protein